MKRPRPGPGLLLVRLLLLVYPADFRRRYGTEMEELFLWQSGRGGSAMERTGRWLRLAGDMAAEGLRERLGRGARIAAPTTGSGGGEDRMGRTIHDLTDAARHLARAPFFTLGAVLIVALGIGANTAVFTLVDAVLLRPPPFDEPDRIVSIYQDSDDGEPSSSSFPAYRDMASFTDVFSGVAAMSATSLTWQAEEGPRPVVAEYVTSSYFPVLGLRPSLGRWFEPSWDEVGAGTYAVVSHHTWRTRMGADPDVVGRTIRLNGHPVTIVGVGPESFNGSGLGIVTDFWLSISSVVLEGPFRVANLDRRQDHWYDVRARLAPDVTVAQAQAAMDALASRLAADYPELNRGREITVFGPGEVRIHPDADRELYSAGGALMAVVLLVLLLACSNLANLLLARGISRGPEMAMRRALGAGRGRVLGLFVAEALLLSLGGGALGLGLGRWALRVVPALPIFPYGAVPDLDLDHRVLLFTLALVLVTGVAFGLAPGLRSARSDLADALREGRGSSSPGRATRLLRNGLVAVQVAVSVVLLAGAALAVRSFLATGRVDTGVDAPRVAYLATRFGGDGVSPAETAVVASELRERLASLPGVTAVGSTTRLPVQGGSSTTTVVEGYEPPSGTGSVELPFAVVGGAYFRAMGIPLLGGRTFGPRDTPESATVVLVSETAARRFWGGIDDALGRRIRPQSAPDQWREVVGVVGDVKVSSLQEPARPMIYFSAGQYLPSSVHVVVRTDGDPDALLGPMRRTLEAVGPALPLDALGTLESHFGEALSMPRMAATLLGAFSLVAVLLATLGIYAVVSFAVVRRTGELGIRIALGAARSRVVRTVVGEVLTTVVLGLVVGLGVALLAASRAQGLLYGIPGVDPLSFGATVLLLVTVSALAAYLPARRAAGADPVEALRAR